MYKFTRLLPAVLACLFAACDGGSDSPPTPPPVVTPAISTQPANQSVSTGAAVTFSVGASGSALRYQWSRDGALIAGATSASLNVPAVKLADTGSKWTVVVSNDVGSVTSSAATLKVTGIELFAGSLTETGDVDGAALQARFQSPIGLAFDSSGDLMVADEYNDKIRRIKPDGTVSTFAGASLEAAGSRYVDGPLALARFSRPYGLAYDGTGNLYVADAFNLAVRKVSTIGDVSTFYKLPLGDPSTGEQIFIDGRSIGFFSPTGVIVDHAGSVHITNGPGTRKIAPDGTLTVVEGKNTINQMWGTSFPWMRGLAVDRAGNLYRANRDHTISKVAFDGTTIVLAGTPMVSGAQDGTGSAAQFSRTMSLAADRDGNLYVADNGNNAIRKVTPEGVVTTVVGQAGMTETKPGALPGNIWNPRGIAVDSTGALYVSFGTGVLKIRL